MGDQTQPEVACNDATNEWTQNSNDLMEDIITSNEMKVNDVQIINNYQQQQQQQQQAFVDTNIAQMDDANTESEQIEKIEEVQAGINGYHNNNDNNNDQSVQADIILNNDNVKEEEEDNNEQQQQQQQQEEDDLSKDVSVKTVSESESAPSQNVENVQPTQTQMTAMAKKAPNSWASFLRTGKNQTASPKRRSLRTVDHVSD